jgi:hypothetical protein
MWVWLKNFCDKAWIGFKEFVKDLSIAILTIEMKELKEIALPIVLKVGATNWIDEEKRRVAIQEIKAEAKKAGKEFKDSQINFMIEALITVFKARF